MQYMRIYENITFCSVFTNCLRPFRDFNHHTVTSDNPPFLFSSETWDAALSSLWLSGLVMIFASFSDTFKCSHTAYMFATLACTSIWSRHVIVWSFIRSFRLFQYLNYALQTVNCGPKFNARLYRVLKAESIRMGVNDAALPNDSLTNKWNRLNTKRRQTYFVLPVKKQTEGE